MRTTNTAGRIGVWVVIVLGTMLAAGAARAANESFQVQLTAARRVQTNATGTAEVSFDLIEHDLSGLPERIQKLRVDELISSEASEPFDLSAGPLMRGALLRVRPEEHVLLITQHHIISDGWSIGVLARELAAATLQAWNVYGPTETTIWSSAAQVTRDDAPPTSSGPDEAPVSE